MKRPQAKSSAHQQLSTLADRFYGQLALAKLGREVPPLGGDSVALPSAQQRNAFEGAPLTAAVREVARGLEYLHARGGTIGGGSRVQ